MAVTPASAATFVVGGAADTIMVAPGASFTVDYRVRVAGPAFNAFDLDVRYDPARLTNVPMAPLSAQIGTLMTSACLLGTPFHLFTPGVGQLTCTVVILCAGVSVTGPGSIYRLGFTAGPTDAWTTLTLGPGTAFYLGGPQVDTLVTRPVVVRIGNPPNLGVGDGPASAPGVSLAPIVPNPSGAAGRLEFSFTLAHDEPVAWQVLDAQGRRVARGAPAAFTAGPHRVALELPGLPPSVYRLELVTASGERVSRGWVRVR